MTELRSENKRLRELLLAARDELVEYVFLSDDTDEATKLIDMINEELGVEQDQ